MQHSPDAVAAQIDAFVTQVRAQTRVPGIAVALSNLQQRIYVNVGATAAGGSVKMSQHSQFRIGCVTKLLLAAVVLELVREGKLDLDAPIGEYLTELRGTPIGDSVRARHLLSHTSGYRGVSIHDAAGRSLTWDRFVDYLRSAPQFFEPGSVFSYEHSEAVLLGQIVRRVTGRDSNQLIHETLLEPLGITAADCSAGSSSMTSAGHHDFEPTAHRFRPSAVAPPMSEFWEPSFARFSVSAADLLTLAEALATPNGSVSGSMSRATLDLMQRRAVTLPAVVGGAYAELRPVAFGCGTAHQRDGFLGHNGLSRGQCIGLRYDPRSKLAIVVGLNAQLPHLRDYILTVLCQQLSGRMAPRTSRSLPFELDELAGFYIGAGHTTVTAERCEDRLILDIGSEGTDPKLRAELIAAENEEPILECPMPEFSLAFFRETRDNTIGLMLALSAYKRAWPRESPQSAFGESMK